MKRKAGESMETVETGAAVVVLPTDAGYVESMKEPFRSMAMKAIPPPKDDAGGETTSVDLAPRLDELEMTLRSGLLEVFHQPDSDSDDSNDNDASRRSQVGEYWKSAVNLCIHLVHSQPEGFANVRKLPLLLLEDCLDGLSVDDAQTFWIEYVEPSLDDVLLGDLLWKSSNVCHLPFLRVANHFLRVSENCSRSQEKDFKGRIQLALAKAFSISDRSALKLWGSFHSAMTTSFESKDVYTGDNYSLYEAFWSLQAYFSNPNRIQVAEFIKKMRLVLAALESSTSTSTNSTASSSAAPNPESVRYLTSSSLLSTQMASPEFRSRVLTQFLIISSHLSAESPPLANALSGLIATSRKLLKKDHPDLYAILDSILQTRETQWRNWKKEKCPASAFGPRQKAATVPKAKRARLLDGPLSLNSGSEEHLHELLGHAELMKISQELVQTAPSLENHLETYVEALDPESGIEDDYHPKNDPMFTWRAMRLMRQHQPEYLKHCRQPADLECMTRELYKSKGEEIPGEYVAVRRDSDDDDDNDDNGDDKDDSEDESSSKDSSKGDDGSHQGEDEQDEDEMAVDENASQDESGQRAKADTQSDEEMDVKSAKDSEESNKPDDTKMATESKSEADDDDGEIEKEPREDPSEQKSSPKTEPAADDDDGQVVEEGGASRSSSPRPEEEESVEDEGVVETNEKQKTSSRSPSQQKSPSSTRDRGVSSPPREATASNNNEQRSRSGPKGGGRRDRRRNDGRGRGDDSRGRGGGHRGGGGGGGRHDHSRGRQDDAPSRNNDDGRRGGRRDDGGAPPRRNDEGGRSDNRGGGGGQGPPPRDGRGGEGFRGDRGVDRRGRDDRQGGGGAGGGGAGVGGGGRRRGGRDDNWGRRR
jgi:THO complex subunit 1